MWGHRSIDDVTLLSKVKLQFPESGVDAIPSTFQNKLPKYRKHNIVMVVMPVDQLVMLNHQTR